jgi:hypothetical protein
MKKYFTLYLILCCAFVAKAQWHPFPLGQKSFYEYPHSQFYSQQIPDSSINIFFHDSIVNHGTYQALHFDYSTPGFDGCYEAINHDPDLLQLEYLNNFRPDSIIKTNDTLQLAYSYYHSSIITDSILFLPQIQKDSSWISNLNNGNTNYNTIKFTCDSIYIDTIVGNIIDSVKLFSIETYNNSTLVGSDFDTLKIILSKNYGFKQFVSFYNIPNQELSIKGINSLSNQEGFQPPGFSDYFHLNTNDVIIWKVHFDSFDPMTPNTTTYYKDSLTSVIVNTDSAIYYYLRTDQSGYQANGTYRFIKDEFTALNVSTSIFCTSNTINIGYPSGPGNLYETSPIYITQDSIVNRKYEFSGYYDPNSCDADLFIDAWNGYHYNTYYGLTSYYNGGTSGTSTNTIEGSIIDGIQIGNVWNVSIHELATKNSFSIYPNPSNDGIFKLSGKNIESIDIISSQGVLIKTVKIVETETSIKLVNQAKGIYFVKSKFKDGNVLTKKLLIVR